MNRYLENSIENMRDLGGYITPYGKTPYYKLIRSNLPQHLSDQDLTFLKSIGISTVIDLRSELEYTKKASSFEKNKNFELIHCPFVVGRDIPTTPQDVPLSYLQILEDEKNILAILNNIICAAGGVLYFCNAGKDRTGVVSALLMMFLGVEREDIIFDYLLTKKYLSEILSQFIAYSERDISNIIIPQRIFIEDFMNGFIKKYATVSNYMENIGFTQEQQNNLRAKLLF